MKHALLGVPLAEKLNLLSELGDLLGKSLNGGHFEGGRVLRKPQGTFWAVVSVGDGEDEFRRLHAPSLV